MDVSVAMPVLQPLHGERYPRERSQIEILRISIKIVKKKKRKELNKRDKEK